MMTPARPAVAGEAQSGWWPSKYGAEDQAGALNEITPGKVLQAVRLVRQGRVYDLAHVLHQDIPAFPGQTFRQYLTTNYHHINRRRSDAGPAGLGRNSVNGYRLADIIEDHGTNRLGIDTLPQVVTRGLLLDVAAARGGPRLQPGDVITVADAERPWPARASAACDPATRCSSTPAGASCGAPTANGTPKASQAPAWGWPPGSPSTGSR